MKVIDHAGNSLAVGRLLRWIPAQQPDLYVRVTEVVAPTPDTPGKVTVELTFGIAPAKGSDSSKNVVQFKDFVTVFDPEEELRTEAALQRAIAEKSPLKAMSAR